MPPHAGFYIAGGLVVLVIVILLLRPLFRRNSTGGVPASNTSWQTTPASAPAADGQERTSVDEPPPAEEEVEEDDEPSLEQLTADADKLMADREYSDALDAYDTAIEKAREDLGPDDLRLADLLVKRGNADRGANGTDYDADDTPWEYTEALAITERHHGPNSEHNLPALKELIAFYDHVGLHDKSNSLLFRTRDIEAAVASAKAASESTGPATV